MKRKQVSLNETHYADVVFINVLCFVRVIFSHYVIGLGISSNHHAVIFLHYILNYSGFFFFNYLEINEQSPHRVLSSNVR